MQIVRGRKLSRLLDLLVIHRKTFTIVQQFETPYNRKKKFAGKPSRLEANPQEPRKFSTVNDLHYTVLPVIFPLYLLVTTRIRLMKLSLLHDTLPQYPEL